MSLFRASTSSFANSFLYSKSSPSGLPFEECACSTERSSWLGHQSLLVCGRPPVLGVGESIAGFSLSLPCAAAESCMTGQPSSALRSTPCGLTGALFSWLSLICFLPSAWAHHRLLLGVNQDLRLSGRCTWTGGQGFHSRQRDHAACLLVPAYVATSLQEPASASRRAEAPSARPTWSLREISSWKAAGSGCAASSSTRARAASPAMAGDRSVIINLRNQQYVEMSLIVVEVASPAATGPLIGHGALGRSVRSGVERAEPPGVCVRAQRFPREAVHKLGGTPPGLDIAERVKQRVLALPAAQRLSDVRVLDHCESMVGRGPQVTDLGRFARRHVHRRMAAGGVDQGDVVGLGHGDPGERCDRCVHIGAGLEQVPDHDRNAEPVSGTRATAQGERDG